jgi:predicted dehydrogenase
VQVWVSDAAGRTAGLSEFPEGIAFTDVSTIGGEMVLGSGVATASMGDLPLAAVHDHLAPYHRMQIEDFVSALRQDREPAVTGVDAVRSLEIVEAIYRSSRTGTAVEIPGR